MSARHYTKIRLCWTSEILSVGIKGYHINGSRISRGYFPAGFFAFSGPAINAINFSGGKKGRTMNPIILPKQIPSVFLVAFGFACFGLLPKMQAVSPPPDGCYPNFTTAEGCNALKFLTSGIGNTGVGAFALYANNDAGSNTAVGAAALALNTADSNTAVGTTA